MSSRSAEPHSSSAPDPVPAESSGTSKGASPEGNAGFEQAFQDTRRSLIERLRNWSDRESWEDFYQTYWRLIYSVATKAGLRREEAFEVVQETILTIAKQQQKSSQGYDPERGSFKNWLLHVTRWRIADQFRKRQRDQKLIAPLAEDDTADPEDPLAQLADPAGVDLEKEWDAEWNHNLTRAALHRVKHRVSPKQFQIFDCYVVKEWPPEQVQETLGVSIAQVYLAKHRVGKLVKQEIEQLRNQLL